MKASDKIYYAILVLAGVAIYAFVMYMCIGFLRSSQLCINKGGIYCWGGIFGVFAFVLPFVYAWFFKTKYLIDKPRWQKAMFMSCSLMVLMFVLYCVFIDLSLITGRDITIELFFILVFLVVPIVSAFKRTNGGMYGGKTDGQKHPTD